MEEKEERKEKEEEGKGSVEDWQRQHLHKFLLQSSPPSRVVIGALTVFPLASVSWADTPFSLLTNTTYCVNGLRPVITPSVMLTLPYMVIGSEKVAIW